MLNRRGLLGSLAGLLAAPLIANRSSPWERQGSQPACDGSWRPAYIDSKMQDAVMVNLDDADIRGLVVVMHIAGHREPVLFLK